MIYAGANWNFAKNGYVRIDEQYAIDVFNTFYIDGRYPIAIDDKTSLTLGRAVLSAEVGRRRADRIVLDLGRRASGRRCARAGGGPAVLHADRQGIRHAEPRTATIRRISTCSRSDFNTAGEKAWGIGGNVDFASLGAPGLTATAIYASGKDRINSPTARRCRTTTRPTSAPTTRSAREPLLEGLVATFRYSWLHQDGSPQTQTELRAILNYAVRF